MFDRGDVDLAILAVLVSLAWVLAAAVVLWTRIPPRPPVGPRTLELGPEPPALANFLVHDFRVTDEALPATVIDLAARNLVDIEQRGPDVFYVRLRGGREEPLTAYERRVIKHVQDRARGGVVPAAALTTGPETQSTKWRRAFEGEVIADAQARALSRDAVGGGVFYALTAATAIPAVLIAVVAGIEAAALAVFAGAGLLGWIRARHPQRETPAGLEAASRWLGVRAELAENEVFRSYSPLTVELWSRLLAYGAGLGVASAASSALPMGAESDTRAWSAYGGRWRLVHVVYPRLWPPAWGRDPVVVLAAGLLIVAGLALLLYLVGVSLLEAGPFGVAIFAVVSLALVLVIATVIVAIGDLRAQIELTGPILRLRTFGDEDEELRYYVAVDDGSSREIRAWRLTPGQYAGLEQGDLVTASVTPNLGRVRLLYRVQDANADE